MKKKLHILALMLLMGAFTQVSAQRYLTEVFSDVTVTKDVVYGNNIGIITGSPAAEDLKVDIYEPTGDVNTDRPLVLFAHTGSFLPTPANGQTTGTKTDSAAVEICMQLAKRGYVAAAYSYRLGWNPASPDQDVRTGTLLNAAYRGIQDARTCVRYFHKDVVTNSNAYGIDTNAIILFGQGTGGYMAYGVASLDKQSEVLLAKFIDINGKPYVNDTLSGDVYGMGGMGLNIPNHVGYSSDIDFAVSLGGAAGDSTWIEAGDAPTVSFHVPSDPFAPYGYGPVIVPVTNQFVVNVSGSQHVQEQILKYNNNACFATPAANWTDAYTTRANANNGGLEGLFPLIRPGFDSAPWEWWDPAHPNHAASSQTNPDMSKTKALAYIDTIMGFSNIRIVTCLGLDTAGPVGVYDDVLKSFLTIAPNPASNQMEIVLNHPSETIQVLELRDLQGKLLRKINGINGQQYVLDRAGLQTGLYLLTVVSENGKTTRKVIFD